MGNGIGTSKYPYLNLKRLKAFGAWVRLCVGLIPVVIDDYRRLVCRSNEYCLPLTKSRLEGHIMLTVHQIEKGLSHQADRRPFGLKKAIDLCRDTRQYIDLYGMTYVAALAVNVLNEYVTAERECQPPVSLAEIEELVGRHGDAVDPGFTATRSITRPPEHDVDSIGAFFASRASVREYSDRDVTDAQIAEACRLAALTPSACNRQASKVYTIRDRIKIDRVIANQLGDQGWVHKAPVLLVVTSDTSYYNASYERMQPYVDGGMFAMNLLSGLHLQRLAACCKMYVRTPAADREFHRITGIPVNEAPIMIVAVGHYPDHPVTTTRSQRFAIYPSEI